MNLFSERGSSGSGRRLRGIGTGSCRTLGMASPWLALALLSAGCTSPPRTACNPDPAPETLGSICGFANPEDVEVVPSAGLLLVSQMRRGDAGGSIAAIALDVPVQQRTAPRILWPGADRTRRGSGADTGADPSCAAPPDRFSPHGITSAATGDAGFVRIAAVGHGEREAVELFDLAGAGDAATLTWRGCVPLPEDTAGNDVALGADGEIVVSNYMPAMTGVSGFYYTLASGMGKNTGDIMTWRRDRGWQHVAGTVAPAPNGIVLSKDGAALLYAETGSGLVRREARSGVDARDQFVMIGGNPDNLSFGADGRILAVTHTDGAAFLLCAFGRHPCRTGWSLFEIDPGNLTATQLLHHDGSVVGAVASAAQAGDRFYFGAVFDDRIGVWQHRRTDNPAR